MKPVHPDESKLSRALFAATLHVKSGTEPSAAAVREVCEELLRLQRLVEDNAREFERAELVAIAAQTLPHDVIQAQLKQVIEPGEKRCPHGVKWEHGSLLCEPCAKAGGG